MPAGGARPAQPAGRGRRAARDDGPRGVAGFRGGVRRGALGAGSADSSGSTTPRGPARVHPRCRIILVANSHDPEARVASSRRHSDVSPPLARRVLMNLEHANYLIMPPSQSHHPRTATASLKRDNAAFLSLGAPLLPKQGRGKRAAEGGEKGAACPRGWHAAPSSGSGVEGTAPPTLSGHPLHCCCRAVGGPRSGSRTA